MFTECKNIRQIPGEAKRRWFTADGLELILWVEQDESIVGFQLCYEAEGKSKALTWDLSSGFIYSGIDDGDIRFGKHKQTPILLQNGVFQKGEILDFFNAQSEGLPQRFAAFVRTKIEECHPGRRLSAN
jgi:hypothetical protein